MRHVAEKLPTGAADAVTGADDKRIILLHEAEAKCAFAAGRICGAATLRAGRLYQNGCPAEGTSTRPAILRPSLVAIVGQSLTNRNRPDRAQDSDQDVVIVTLALALSGDG